MPLRIIYCALSCVGLLANLEHEKLGTLEPGIIAAVPDDVLEQVLKTGSEAAILFLSRDAYDAAIGGLMKPEVDKTLRSRLASWSTNVLGDAFEIVGDGERRALALAAHLHAQSSDRSAQVLHQHFSAGLDLLTSFTDEGRFDDIETGELLEVAIEKEAVLLAEVNDSDEVKMRTDFARTLAEELKRLGDPAYAEALPGVEPLRGVWVTPADEELREALRWRGEPVVDFRDGIMTVASERLLGEPPFMGKHSSVLYADAGQFYEDVDELSPPELNRRLDERLTADDASRRKERTDYLNALRVEQASMRRIVYQRAAQEQSSLAADLAEQIDLETADVMNRLASSDTWVDGAWTTPALPRLTGAEDHIVRDVRLLLFLSRRSGDDYMVGRLDAVLKTKQADRDRSASLPR